MPLNIDYLRSLKFKPSEHTVADKDAMLYALSVGLGRNPLDALDLRYVYENNLKVFPTMPLVIGHPGEWTSDPQTGVTRTMVVHGSQRLTMHVELPIGKPVVTTNEIISVLDKGDKGAVVSIERKTFDKASGALIAVGESSAFCRADGNFTGSFGVASEFQSVPSRHADFSARVETQENAALLYRLNQDRNPLHADPAVARRAGYERPILHGLCTLGMTAVALTRWLPDRRLRSLEARFSKPLLPGELLTIEMWNEGESVAFQVKTDARGGSVVLDRGRATLE
jgi:acyl dehydratase